MMLSYLQDALKDELLLHDEDTVGQLGSYKQDKRTERSDVAEMLNSGKANKRRERHHWTRFLHCRLLVSLHDMLRGAIRRRPRRSLKMFFSSRT